MRTQILCNVMLVLISRVCFVAYRTWWHCRLLALRSLLEKPAWETSSEQLSLLCAPCALLLQGAVVRNKFVFKNIAIELRRPPPS